MCWIKRRVVKLDFILSVSLLGNKYLLSCFMRWVFVLVYGDIEMEIIDKEFGVG